MAEPTAEQRKAIRAFIDSTLLPLIGDVMEKKLTQAALTIRDLLEEPATQAPRKQWPFVETPGEFTERLRAAMDLFDRDLLAAVRYVLIETPPTIVGVPEVPRG